MKEFIITNPITTFLIVLVIFTTIDNMYCNYLNSKKQLMKSKYSTDLELFIDSIMKKAKIVQDIDDQRNSQLSISM